MKFFIPAMGTSLVHSPSFLEKSRLTRRLEQLASSINLLFCSPRLILLFTKRSLSSQIDVSGTCSA